jgi:hypothetical protein
MTNSAGAANDSLGDRDPLFEFGASQVGSFRQVRFANPRAGASILMIDQMPRRECPPVSAPDSSSSRY